ncbi:MAG: serine hydrolase, partial [Bacteroidia bacterium]|nr:serine hydrolase [Bacteroidia bacterium]
RYSDLSMILMQQVIEKLTAMPLDQYVQKNFYDSMHLEKITYNPWKKYPVSEVAPTQNDQLFRKQLIQGYVHDPGAAMMGGVAGHAGVFSDAHDLATIMQMLNDGGVYNGTRYFKTATIEEFTKYHSTKSRRGLGFDKPDFSGKTSPASAFCSEETFGHTGFTGTCAWADPKYDLVFVFLSNRIYPDEENKNLINGSYRIKIQDIIYQSIGK